jgi:aminopyrrolnitrin oxygenase
MTEAGLTKSWYPAALSKDLGGKPHAIAVFGGSYLLFRGRSGQLTAIARHCLHMGADLSRSQVVGDGLRCGLHGWIYGLDGVCRHVPGAPAGTEARLRRLATHETGGVIFVWPGPEADWPFPEFPGLADPRAARPRAIEFACPVEAVALNGFDIWHYGIVHRRRVLPEIEVGQQAPHHISLAFSADVMPGRFRDDMVIRLGLRRLDVKLDYWGGNIIMVRNLHSRYLAMIALAPAGDGRCRIFIAVFAERRNGPLGLTAQTLQLELFRWIAYSFLRSDFPFVAGMRPEEGLLIPGKDDIARAFWRWWRALPRVEALPS